MAVLSFCHWLMTAVTSYFPGLAIVVYGNDGEVLGDKCVIPLLSKWLRCPSSISSLLAIIVEALPFHWLQYIAPAMICTVRMNVWNQTWTLYACTTYVCMSILRSIAGDDPIWLGLPAQLPEHEEKKKWIVNGNLHTYWHTCIHTYIHTYHA